MAGTWGMTDEQVARKAKSYRRRWLLIAVGNLMLSCAHLIAYFSGDADKFRLGLGIAFALIAVLAALAWHRGLPDTRPTDMGAKG